MSKRWKIIFIHPKDVAFIINKNTGESALRIMDEPRRTIFSISLTPNQVQKLLEQIRREISG